MRKQKLDEKRCLHLLGAGQLNYLQEIKKISRQEPKFIHLTTPKKDWKCLSETLSKRINFIPVSQKPKIKLHSHGENETVLIDQSFASNIKILRFALVHCSFDMIFDCLRSLKLQ